MNERALSHLPVYYGVGSSGSMSYVVSTCVTSFAVLSMVGTFVKMSPFEMSVETAKAMSVASADMSAYLKLIVVELPSSVAKENTHLLVVTVVFDILMRLLMPH